MRVERAHERERRAEGGHRTGSRRVERARPRAVDRHEAAVHEPPSASGSRWGPPGDAATAKASRSTCGSSAATARRTPAAVPARHEPHQLVVARAHHGHETRAGSLGCARFARARRAGRAGGRRPGSARKRRCASAPARARAPRKASRARSHSATTTRITFCAPVGSQRRAGGGHVLGAQEGLHVPALLRVALGALHSHRPAPAVDPVHERLREGPHDRAHLSGAAPVAVVPLHHVARRELVLGGPNIRLDPVHEVEPVGVTRPRPGRTARRSTGRSVRRSGSRRRCRRAGISWPSVLRARSGPSRLRALAPEVAGDPQLGAVAAALLALAQGRSRRARERSAAGAAASRISARSPAPRTSGSARASSP